MRFKTEQTDAGAQTLVPGVTPLKPQCPLEAERNRRKAKQEAGQDNPGGMFDANARAQVDLCDLL